jgi:hypothetical protein
LASRPRSTRDADLHLDEYFSAHWEEWPRLLQQFVDHGVTEHLGPFDLQQLAEANLEALNGILNRLRAARSRDDAAAHAPAISAIKDLGLAALRPSDLDRATWDPSVIPRERHQQIAILREKIRGLVWERIEQWHRAARSGRNAALRLLGAKLLRDLGAALAGEQRGKRRDHVAQKRDVVFVYYSTLFRFRRAVALLRAWPWGGSWQHRIKMAEQACALWEGQLGSDDPLQSHLRLDTEGSVIRPETIEAAARIATARAFGITEPTVSNLLVRRRPPKTRTLP